MSGISDWAASPAVGSILTSFAKLFSRFHWTSLLSAALIAFGVWLWRRRSEPEATEPNFLSFLFPRNVWLHRSALLDYRFVLFDKVALAVLIALGTLLILPPDTLEKGGRWALADASRASLPILVAYTVTLLVVEDFFRYWAHRWMHTSAFLWQFHKVHHSAEVLVPVSQLRTHPVNGIVNLSRSALAIPIVTGLFLLIFPGKLTAMSILGVNAGRFVFDILGAQLRHSHVWLCFGPILSRIVISPAQHQIHHSSALEHRNRNYGSQFALWDWLFGTLYVPKGRETLTLGIGEAESARLRSIASLYLVPFKDAWAVLRGAWKSRREKRAAEAVRYSRSSYASEAGARGA